MLLHHVIAHAPKLAPHGLAVIHGFRLIFVTEHGAHSPINIHTSLTVLDGSKFAFGKVHLMQALLVLALRLNDCEKSIAGLSLVTRHLATCWANMNT